MTSREQGKKGGKNQEGRGGQSEAEMPLCAHACARGWREGGKEGVTDAPKLMKAGRGRKQ